MNNVCPYCKSTEAVFDSNRAHFLSLYKKSGAHQPDVIGQNQAKQISQMIEKQNEQLMEKDDEIQKLRVKIIANTKKIQRKEQLEKENVKLQEEIELLRKMNTPFDFEVPHIFCKDLNQKEIQTMQLKNDEFQKLYENLTKVENESILVQKKLKFLEKALGEKCLSLQKQGEVIKQTPQIIDKVAKTGPAMTVQQCVSAAEEINQQLTQYQQDYK